MKVKRVVREVVEEVAEVVAPKVERKMLILPEGMHGSELKRKVVLPQNSKKAQELIDKKYPKADEAEPVKSVTIAQAKAAKAEKAGKTEKKAKATKVARYEGGVTSMEGLGYFLLCKEADAEEIAEAFLKAYALKGITDLEFIAPRIKIYMKIASDKKKKEDAKLVKEEASKE